MAHTKGPWSCNNNVGVVFGEGCQVAVCGDFHDAELVPYNADRWRADARLISLAPEMLEALEEFVARVDAGEVRSVRTAAKFRALIARAKGGA